MTFYRSKACTRVCVCDCCWCHRPVWEVLVTRAICVNWNSTFLTRGSPEGSVFKSRLRATRSDLTFWSHTGSPLQSTQTIFGPRKAMSVRVGRSMCGQSVFAQTYTGSTVIKKKAMFIPSSRRSPTEGQTYIVEYPELNIQIDCLIYR